MRFAGHKVKRDTRQKAKQPGVKRMDGDFVRAGEIIVSQFNLSFHPGLNVRFHVYACNFMYFLFSFLL